MEFKFTEENLHKVRAAIKKYPYPKAAVMELLYLGQSQNGYISGEVMNEVAALLNMDPVDVLSVVTFYTMYHQKQPGKFHIQVCTNVSCMLRGGYELLHDIENKLGIKKNDLTSDGKFSIEEVECMGSCGTAPMIAINEDFYENLTKEKVSEILDSLS